VLGFAAKEFVGIFKRFFDFLEIPVLLVSLDVVQDVLNVGVVPKRTQGFLGERVSFDHLHPFAGDVPVVVECIPILVLGDAEVYLFG